MAIRADLSRDIVEVFNAKIADQALNDRAAGLARARVTGEFRPHAPRYPRRP